MRRLLRRCSRVILEDSSSPHIFPAPPALLSCDRMSDDVVKTSKRARVTNPNSAGTMPRLQDLQEERHSTSCTGLPYDRRCYLGQNNGMRVFRLIRERSEILPHTKDEPLPDK